MNKYKITVNCSAGSSFEIEANSKEEAESQAWGQQVGGFDLEFISVDSIEEIELIEGIEGEEEKITLEMLEERGQINFLKEWAPVS